MERKQALGSFLTTDWMVKHLLELFFKGHIELTTGIQALPHCRGPGEHHV